MESAEWRKIQGSVSSAAVRHYLTTISQDHWRNHWVLGRLADPDPGSSASLTCGSGMGRKIKVRIRDEHSDHIYESLETVFWAKNTCTGSLLCGSGIRNIFDPGSGIRDGKNSDTGWTLRRTGTNTKKSALWQIPCCFEWLTSWVTDYGGNVLFFVPIFKVL